MRQLAVLSGWHVIQRVVILCCCASGTIMRQLGEGELQVTIHREREIEKFKKFRRWHSLDAREQGREAVMIRHRHTARASPAPSEVSSGLISLRAFFLGADFSCRRREIALRLRRCNA